MGDFERVCTIWYGEDESALAVKWSIGPEYQDVQKARQGLLESFASREDAHFVVFFQDVEPVIHELAFNPSRYDVCPKCTCRIYDTCMCEEVS